MRSHSCCGSQNNVLLRGLRSGDEFSSGRAAGRHDSKSSFAGKSMNDRNAASPENCGMQRRISRTDSVGRRNGALDGGMESSLSQAGRQRLETSSPGLLRDSILDPLSLSRRCAVSSGLVVAASSTSSSKAKEDGDVNPKTSRPKLSMRTLAVAACFGGIAGLITTLLSTLPPNFEHRWRMLLDNSPQAEESRQVGPQSPTVLFDRHGVVIATIAPGGYSYKRDDDILPGNLGKSRSVSLAEIPFWMWQAVVASEDRRFFEHHGVDARGLSRAVLSLATRGGGSTITQQLVKNVILTSERTWTRKLSEILLAIALETQMSKQDILHCYLKKIYWGHGVYGIEGASALYFGKHPSCLTLGECAMLAGIIPAPELLSPYRDPSRGKKPQARALRRMVEAGFLDTASAAELVREPLKLAIESTEGTSGPWKAPYFVSEVLNELTQRYGWPKVACGGLQVHTTLDLSMQNVAEKVVLTHLVKYENERILLADEGLQKAQGRLGALQAERQKQVTKVVKAIKGSTKEQAGDNTNLSGGKKVPIEDASSKSRVGQLGDISSSITSTKAAGAVIKQFFAAEDHLQATLSKYQDEIKAAEQSRMEAAMVAIDPLSGAVRVLVGGRNYYESNFNHGTQAFRSPGSTFKPVVYLTALAEGFGRDHMLKDEPITIGGFTQETSDRKFSGQVTLEESLLYSLNIPTVRLCSEVGVDKVCEMGRALGIETFLPNELALALGGCEVTPMQLATVYATIAAGGVHHKPHLISRIESQEGEILEDHEPSKGEQQVPVVNDIAVAELRRLLQAVVDKGTGQAAQLGWPCAGKSGTSSENRDVWFAGFTPEISCVVWLGYDDNAPVGGLHPASGASHAAPIWKEFMKAVHQGVPIRKFHDAGTGKDSSRAPKQIIKRSRRTRRIGLHKIRKNQKKKTVNIPWKQVWDWNKASSAWEEQEKMDHWVALRRRTASTPDWRLQPQPSFVDPQPIFSQT